MTITAAPATHKIARLTYDQASVIDLLPILLGSTPPAITLTGKSVAEVTDVATAIQQVEMSLAEVKNELARQGARTVASPAHQSVLRKLRSLAGEQVPEVQEEAEAPAPVEVDPALAAITDKELLNMARAEDKAARAARKAGEDVPPTPHLDELNRRHQEGEMGPVARQGGGKRRKASAPAKVEQPAPKVARGFTAIALRNDKHGEVIAAAIGQTGDGESSVDGKYLIVRNADAQAIADQLLAAQDGASVFHKRLLTLAHLSVRCAFPKVTDERGALTARVVTKLNELEMAWSVGWANDAQPRLSVGGQEVGTIGQVAEMIRVPTKAS